MGADVVVADAEVDQVLDRAGVQVAGDHRDDHRVAGDPAGRVPVQPGAAVPGGHRRGGPLRGPPGPVLDDPPLLQDRITVQGAQVRERHVHQGLDRLPGPFGQQVRGQQPAHRFFQGVVVALRAGPQIPAPRRSGQRIQHRARPWPRTPGTGRRAAPRPRQRWFPGTRRGQGPGRQSGSGGAVRERISAQISASARRSAPARAAAIRISSAWPRYSPGMSRVHRASWRAIDLWTVWSRSPASSGAVALGQPLHGLVLEGLALGDPGGVHQPGPDVALPVGHRAVLGVERGQHRAPRCRRDRVGLLHAQQALSQHWDRQGRGVQVGEETPGRRPAWPGPHRSWTGSLHRS